MSIADEKKILRKATKAKVLQISDKTLRAEKILEQIKELPEFKAASNIMSFSPLSDEIQINTLNDLIYKEKTLLLPRINNAEIEVVQFTGKMKKEERFGIDEPVGEIVTDLSQIDIIFIPGVAFDKQNHRLGRGKSFYDRFLPKTKALKIGICYAEQVAPDVPIDEFDVCMDKIIFA